MQRLRVVTLIVLFSFMFRTTIVFAQTQQIEQTTYQDFIKQCIAPAVGKAVDTYYGEHRRIALWEMDILDIKRDSKGSYWFEITVQVKTSKGSFNPPYGTEIITLSNLTKPGEGDYKVIKFIHQDDNRNP